MDSGINIMKIAPKSLAITLFCTLPLLGCGGDSDGDSSPTELEGSWQMGCNFNTENNSYDIEGITLSGLTYSGELLVSSDADCSLSRFSYRENGTFEIGEEMILNSGITVKEFNRTPNEAFLTLMEDELVTSNNTRSLCGYSNWQKNIEVDVSNCAALYQSGITYDIYKIDETNLFLGDNDFGDGSSEDDRPTQLESTFYSKS